MRLGKTRGRQTIVQDTEWLVNLMEAVNGLANAVQQDVNALQARLGRSGEGGALGISRMCFGDEMAGACGDEEWPKIDAEKVYL